VQARSSGSPAEAAGLVGAERGRPRERAIDEPVSLAADLALGERPDLDEAGPAGQSSEMVGTVRKFDEPVSTNWPGAGSRSTASLIARTSG